MQRYPSRRGFLKAGAAATVSPVLLGFRPPAFAADPTPGPYSDAVLQSGAPPLPKKGSFTIAVLPDTQGYSMSYPENYVAQTEWIVKHRDDRNISCVLHLGDITNNNTHVQWKNAVRAMNVLDDQVPYFMALGNHDYGTNGGCSDRSTFFHEYFPLDKFNSRQHFGGSYDKEPDRFDNCYHKLTAGDRDFLVLSLEFGPRNDVVRWANEVADQFSDHSIILITHAFVYYDDTRYNWAKYGGDQLWNPHSYPVAKRSDHDVNDGQELWDNLISQHDNFIMTLNGHVCADGIGRVTTPLPNGEQLPQLLVNFQVKPDGGDGWLRLLEFHSDGTTVSAYDYSVTRNECNLAKDNTFEMSIPAA